MFPNKSPIPLKIKDYPCITTVKLLHTLILASVEWKKVKFRKLSLTDAYLLVLKLMKLREIQQVLLCN